MIKVTVELISARTGLTETLGTAIIANDATGTLTKGNYRATFYRKDGGVWRHGRVTGFNRKSTGVWRLLKAALENAVR